MALGHWALGPGEARLPAGGARLRREGPARLRLGRAPLLRVLTTVAKLAATCRARDQDADALALAGWGPLARRQLPSSDAGARRQEDPCQHDEAPTLAPRKRHPLLLAVVRRHGL